MDALTCLMPISFPKVELLEGRDNVCLVHHCLSRTNTVPECKMCTVNTFWMNTCLNSKHYAQHAMLPLALLLELIS